MDTVQLMIPCGFDALEYSWMKATIGISTLADYSVAKNANTHLQGLGPHGSESGRP
jgi:hypothetical protein